MARTHANARNMAATALIANGAATRAVPANAYKYGANHKAIATKAVTYGLTALGAATATAACGKSGKPTVMALVAVATAAAMQRNNGQPVSGQAIVLAMRTLPAVVAAYGNTKAGKYAPAGTLPPHAWCSGYVAGAARNPACLLAAVTPAA
jgi:hypothetical protein